MSWCLRTGPVASRTATARLEIFGSTQRHIPSSWSKVVFLTPRHLCYLFFFFLMIRRPPRSPLFPYTPPSRSLPRLAGSELSRAVAFEGRRLVPMEAAEVYFAWHASRDSSGYAVYLVAARRAMIDAVVAAEIGRAHV